MAKDTHRAQAASIMRRAAAILGSEKALADHLGVAEAKLSMWIQKLGDCPQDSMHKAVDVILHRLDHLEDIHRGTK